MNLALIIIHVVISVILIVVVLMQHGKQQGLSGAIAGGAETFFGKNKGRTIDAMLKKFTAVIAVLFVISSVTLTVVSVNQSKAEQAAAEEATQETTENGDAAQTIPVEDGEVTIPVEGEEAAEGEGVAEGDAAAADENAAASGETAAEDGAEGEQTPAE